MSLRIYDLVLIAVSFFTFSNTIHGGKYDYDPASGGFKEKSKKQAFRVVIVDSSTPAQRSKIHSSSWEKFLEQRNAIDNLDLWLAQFASGVSDEISQLDLDGAQAKERLDTKLRREILVEKRRELHKEIARPKFSRRFWQKSPTDDALRALQKAHDKKLKLYDEIYDGALNRHINAEINKAVSFCARLEVRNREEEEALGALNESSTSEAVEEVRSRIDADHLVIMHLLKSSIAKKISEFAQGNDVEIQEFDRICQNYVTIIQHHQHNYEAIGAIIEAAQREEETSDDEDHQAIDEFAHGVAKVAVAPFALVGYGVIATAERAKAGYESVKGNYHAHKTEMRRRKDQHLSYLAHAENDFNEFIPDGLTEDEVDIYRRSFSKYARSRYRHRDMDFAGAANRESAERLQQFRRIGELRNGLRAIESDIEISDSARKKIRRSTKRSLSTVQRRPALGDDHHHSFAAIKERIQREEIAKIQRRSERKLDREQRKASKLARIDARRLRLEQDKQRSREYWEHNKERTKQRKRDRALEKERLAQAHALYKSIKRELIRRYQQRLAEEENVDSLMLMLLATEGSREKSQSAAYNRVFNRMSLSRLVSQINKPNFDAFWSELIEKYRSGAEAHIAHLQKERLRDANLARNLDALRVEVEALRMKPDTDRSVKETLLLLFIEEANKKKRSRYYSHAVFGNEDLRLILASHDTYENFLDDIDKRFEARTHAYLAKLDQQLLLKSAKKGLSKKGAADFRKNELSRLSEELTAIRLRFDISPVARVLDARSSASTSRTKNRVDEALRELLANQDAYEKLIGAYGLAAVGTNDNDDDDDLSQEENKDEDVIELDQAVLRQHFENWYVPFPKSCATAMHIANDCVICRESIGYDLEFSADNGMLIQKPKQGTHKLSGCGHMLCTVCLREMEARAKKIKKQIAMGENMLSPYQCPLCQSNIASDELNDVEFEKACGRIDSAHLSAPLAFYSADCEHSADIYFARKAMDAWTEKWRAVANSIVRYRPDESLERAHARRKTEINNFARSGHSTTLSEFIDATNQDLLEREANIEIEISRVGLANWYASLVDFGLASIVGAEWIVSFPSSVREMERATTTSARSLLAPERFGYDLRRQTPKARSDVRKICRNQEKAVCDRSDLDLDLTDLPRTWQQFSERNLAATTTAMARMNEAIGSCQAEIDRFVLESNQGENLAETIALRIEREHCSERIEMSSELAQEYRNERDSIRAKFIADLRMRSVSVAKEDNSAGIPLEQLTASYRAHVDRVNSKYGLIQQFTTSYNKHMRNLAKKDLSDATKRSYVRNRIAFQIASIGKLREELYLLLKIRAEQNQERDESELLAMPVTSDEEMKALEERRATILALAEKEWKQALSQIAQGGIANPNWDRDINSLHDRVIDLLQREVSMLESRVASIALPDARAVFSSLITHLKNGVDEFSVDFDKLLSELKYELSQSSVDRYQDIISDFAGEERISSLWKIGDGNSKFSLLVASLMHELRAVLAVENSIEAAGRKLERLERSLNIIFPDENSEIATALFQFANMVRDNKTVALASGSVVASKIHEIHEREADALKPLVKAIIQASEEMAHCDVRDFAGALSAVSDLMWFINHAEYVHNLHNFDATKNLLLRILRNDKMKIRFSALRLYRELLRDLTKSTGDKSATAFKPEPSIAAASSSKAGPAYSGIPNVGNTCFANACLQALSRVNEWGRRHPLQPVSSKAEASKDVTAFRELTEGLVSAMRVGDMEGLRGSLMPFFDLVYKTLPNFVGLAQGLQRDAQEFWIDMLDVLGIDKPDVNSPLNFGASTFIKPSKDSVQGEYVEPVPMHALILPLEGKKTTLKIALENWLQEHEFEREGFNGTMYTQALLHNPPDVMTIVINRFDANNRKLNIPVAINDATIPFHKFDSAGGLNDVENISYRLVGGVYHSGKTTNSGHYYFIDHVTGIVFDDAETYQLSLLDEKIIQRQSYVLFLQRVAP